MSVIEALAKVAEELPSIGRDGQASQAQGGYAYRGIEAIARHASPLLAKHQVVFVPKVQSCEIRDIVVNGKPWTDTILTVGYRICGPGGPEDFVEATVVGIGRDNADKGANKALTQAFKYVLTQTLCIADGKDDGDGQTVERDAAPPRAAQHDLDELKARVEMLDPETRDRFVAWKNDQGFPFPWPQTAVDAMHGELDKITAVAGGPDAPSPGTEGAPLSSASLLSASPPAGGEPHGYELWSKDDLAAECKERELPFSQTKERMVRELRAWDQAYNPEAVEHDARPF